MATDHRHPQPPQAPQAPDSRRRRLKGPPNPWLAPITANATINTHIAAHASRPFERQPPSEPEASCAPFETLALLAEQQSRATRGPPALPFEERSRSLVRWPG